MAGRYASVSRSLISTARISLSRSSAPQLISPHSLIGHRINSRRLLSIANLGTIGGVIGCNQSLLPLYSVVADAHLTSHISVEARACCELTQGT